ncbi:MAG: hypothetical protein RLZZ628_36 [Bacteroidota bacterium]
MQFKTVLTLCLLFFGCIASAQSSKDPVWHTMIQDPNVNYYQAKRAYDDYWKGKMPPPNKDKRHSEAYQAYFKGLTKKEKIEYDRVCWMSKTFRDWMVTNAAWVQPDGHILSPTEQTAILTRQQQELKAIEQKNGKF